ncbi:MAG: alpha/beta fold hydrolase [Candidatus Aminicenantes bacterium]|nr:alpha/beta fold hydrolase [Candidatus Aminicenantes bacterium]
MKEKPSVPRRIAAILLVLSPLAAAETAAVVDGPAAATRADLAAAYLRFEEAFLRASLDEPELVRVNKEFDGLTLFVFAGNFARAVERLNALAESIAPEIGRRFPAPLRALRPRIEPRSHVLGGPAPVLFIEPILEQPQAGSAIRAAVRLSPLGKAKEIDIPFAGSPQAGPQGALSISLEPFRGRLLPGRYRVGFSSGRAFYFCGVWSVVAKPLAARAASNAARLDKIIAATPALRQALAAVKARNALLPDTGGVESSARMMIDPEALAGQVEEEIRALEEGRLPFRGRRGDYWRVVRSGEEDVPVRVFHPASAGEKAPPPLVVALHGASGDENMFPDGYGVGMIKTLAEKHGFILVSPSSYAFGASKAGRVFDDLLEAVAFDHPFDPGRVFVLGHSMGGVFAGALAGLRPEKIAAATCLCGFSGFGAGASQAPPTLVAAAELDPIVPPSRLEAAFQKARTSGFPVEYRPFKNLGHTLAVGRMLPEVVAWLLTK